MSRPNTPSTPKEIALRDLNTGKVTEFTIGEFQRAQDNADRKTFIGPRIPDNYEILRGEIIIKSLHESSRAETRPEKTAEQVAREAEVAPILEKLAAAQENLDRLHTYVPVEGVSPEQELRHKTEIYRAEEYIAHLNGQITQILSPSQAAAAPAPSPPPLEEESDPLTETLQAMGFDSIEAAETVLGPEMLKQIALETGANIHSSELPGREAASPTPTEEEGLWFEAKRAGATAPVPGAQGQWWKSVYQPLAEPEAESAAEEARRKREARLLEFHETPAGGGIRPPNTELLATFSKYQISEEETPPTPPSTSPPSSSSTTPTQSPGPVEAQRSQTPRQRSSSQ